VATPVPSRNGWLIEQIIRGREAPNGTAELLIDAAFRAAAAGGLEYFTLGLSPLSQILPETYPQPWWLSFAFRQLRKNGRIFYDFPGLEQFKAKFWPQNWEPIYAICNIPTVTPNIIMAIAAAFGGHSPMAFMALALRKILFNGCERVLLDPGDQRVPRG
jgi:phosphatidylglycerol lysyltransferase